MSLRLSKYKSNLPSCLVMLKQKYFYSIAAAAAAAVHGDNQCDQIGQFLKVFCDKFT